MACSSLLSDENIRRFRTKPCRRNRQIGGSCEFGSNRCQYSHCDEWVRRCPFYLSDEKSIRYIPEVCPNVVLGHGLTPDSRSIGSVVSNTCTRGGSCPFAHSVEEVLYHPLIYKTQSCVAFTQGECLTYYCPYIHGTSEARDTGAITFNLPFTQHLFKTSPFPNVSLISKIPFHNPQFQTHPPLYYSNTKQVSVPNNSSITLEDLLDSSEMTGRWISPLKSHFPLNERNKKIGLNKKTVTDKMKPSTHIIDEDKKLALSMNNTISERFISSNEDTQETESNEIYAVFEKNLNKQKSYYMEDKLSLSKEQTQWSGEQWRSIKEDTTYITTANDLYNKDNHSEIIKLSKKKEQKDCPLDSAYSSPSSFMSSYIDRHSDNTNNVFPKLKHSDPYIDPFSSILENTRATGFPTQSSDTFCNEIYHNNTKIIHLSPFDSAIDSSFPLLITDTEKNSTLVEDPIQHMRIENCLIGEESNIISSEGRPTIQTPLNKTTHIHSMNCNHNVFYHENNGPIETNVQTNVTEYHTNFFTNRSMPLNDKSHSNINEQIIFNEEHDKLNTLLTTCNTSSSSSFWTSSMDDVNQTCSLSQDFSLIHEQLSGSQDKYTNLVDSSNFTSISPQMMINPQDVHYSFFSDLSELNDLPLDLQQLFIEKETVFSPDEFNNNKPTQLQDQTFWDTLISPGFNERQPDYSNRIQKNKVIIDTLKNHSMYNNFIDNDHVDKYLEHLQHIKMNSFTTSLQSENNNTIHYYKHKDISMLFLALHQAITCLSMLNV